MPHPVGVFDGSAIGNGSCPVSKCSWKSLILHWGNSLSLYVHCPLPLLEEITPPLPKVISGKTGK